MVAPLIVCISFCSTVPFASFGFRVNHLLEFTLVGFPLNRANLGNRNRTRFFSAPCRKSKCWSCLKDTSLVLISAILETRFCELYEMKRFRRTAESLRKNCNEIINIGNAGLGLFRLQKHMAILLVKLSNYFNRWISVLPTFYENNI